MAQGPMSVGAKEAINFLTDKTLTKEDIAADAKVVGTELAKKFNNDGGVLNGDMEFPQIGPSGTQASKKVLWKTENSNASISVVRSGSGTIQLVIDTSGGSDGEIVFRRDGKSVAVIGKDGKYYGNLFGTAMQATNADNADTVDNIHFVHGGSTNLTQMLGFAGVGSDGKWTVGYRELDDIYKAELNQTTFEDYIKFQNGMLVCWGVGASSGSVVFPHAFCHTDYALQVTPIVDVLHDFYVSGRSSTGFTTKQNGITSTAKTLWTAIGWWKRESRTLLDSFKDIVESVT